ncbi:MAG TPA: flagellar biosynthesis protein FlhA, partial [Candidatus Eremiobacteraeota bacterium]|nr:flagellar biosynthesis protein FlhA [Candidatus Eremiobacteraeota bacterium]
LENLDIRKWLDNIPVREKIPAQETILKPVFRISIEFGLNLIPLVDPNKGAKLLERVNSIRRYISSELGLMVPGIGFRDNLQLKPDSYIIKINEFEIATGEVRLDRLLAIGPWNCLKLFTGPRCLEPTYGLPAVWIKIEERNEAERKGCMVFDSESVIGTHLTEIIRQHASELIGRQEIANMLATLKKSHPALEVYPELYNLGEIKIILQNLLKEQVSIRDIVTIMEILADYGTVTKNPDKLTEYVRHALRRDICREYQDGTGKIFVLTLNTKIEKIIERAVEKNKSFLEFKTGSNIIKVLDKHIKGIKDQGMQPILLCSPKIRLYIKRLTERFFPNLVVLAYNEIENGINVINVGCVSLPCYFTFLKVRVKKIIFYIEQYIKKQYLKWKYFKKTPLQKSVENDRYIRTEIVDKSLSNTCKHCGYKNNIQHGFIENYCAHCGKNLFNTEPTVDIEKINYLCLRLDVDKDVAIKSLMEYNNPRNALLNLKEKIKELQWASKKGDRRKDEIEYIAHKSCETDKIDEKNNLIKMTTSIESLGLDDKIKEIIKQTGISSYEAFLALTDVECCLDNALNLIKSNSDNQPVEEQKYKTIHELREVLYEPETWNKIEYITRETSCKISDAFKALIESSEDELSAVKAIQERKKEKKKEN